MTLPKLIIAALAGAGLAWPAHTLLARDAGTPRTLPQKQTTAPLVAAIATGDETLRSLLANGYDVINVDAPAGSGAARFILRKNLDIYSCEQTTYREGGADGVAHVISGPCLKLTQES